MFKQLLGGEFHPIVFRDYLREALAVPLLASEEIDRYALPSQFSNQL